MRKVKLTIGAVALFALSWGFALQNVAAAQDMTSGATPHVAAEPQPLDAPAANATATDCGCAQEACGCNQCGRRQGCYARTLAKWAEVGNFNCHCRGSYKFPVPPQYTYFWPGMYSQQTMTEYASPYRFPGLKLPPGSNAKQPAGPNLGTTSPQVKPVSHLHSK